MSGAAVSFALSRPHWPFWDGVAWSLAVMWGLLAITRAIQELRQ
jgi:hypothetical protein